jgi:hypothetical protein
LFVYLFVFAAHVFWVSFALLLLFPTFVVTYPFALCFVLCFALLFSPSPKSIPLHNFGTHSHHSPPSLSLSLSTFVSFFMILQKFVFYVSFRGKILAKFCFANFDRNPKRKGGKKKKTKRRSSRERVCLLLLVDAFFFGWRFFQQEQMGTTPFLLFHKISCTKLPSLIDS